MILLTSLLSSSFVLEGMQKMTYISWLEAKYITHLLHGSELLANDADLLPTQVLLYVHQVGQTVL